MGKGNNRDLKRNGSAGSDKNPTKKSKLDNSETRTINLKVSDIQCTGKSIAIQDLDKEAEPSNDAAFDADLANPLVEDKVTTLHDNEETEAGTSDLAPRPVVFRSATKLLEAKQRRLKKQQIAYEKTKAYEESRRVASILTGRMKFQATKDEDVFKNGDMECILNGITAEFTGADKEAATSMKKKLTRYLRDGNEDSGSNRESVTLSS
jgi:hypothetical protein